MALSPIPELLADLQAGKFIVLVDEEDRENEGDLIMAAPFVNAEAINFMAKFGRGLICMPVTKEHADRLGLAPMVSKNGTVHGTNFTASIEAATGVSTGISAADRAHTIRVACAPNAKAADIVSPGHVFPLIAQDGGVLMRAGHTEAVCDLARLAGFAPCGVLVEIMNDDGTMSRLPQLEEFAKLHGLKIGAISDLIHYRSETERLVETVGRRAIHTAWGDFTLVTLREKLSHAIHMALVHGEPSGSKETLVRVHEPLSVLDLLDENSAVHSWPLGRALRRIRNAPAGVVVLLHQAETPQALEQRISEAKPLNAHKMDLRTYGIGAQILRELGVGKMRLLAKQRKMPSMGGWGLDVVGFEEAEQ
jgi:3,4-dihydroxy 2-butanone 4-phosphate synthase / GTP cyclohydrolase II